MDRLVPEAIERVLGTQGRERLHLVKSSEKFSLRNEVPLELNLRF